MSDSDHAISTPSDAQITSTLNQIVTRTYKDDLANLTLKRVRKAIEDELDLSNGWLKEHDKWAEKSKELITSEVKRLEEAGSDDSDKEKPVARKLQKKANGKATASATPKKRKSPDAPKKAPKAKPKPRKKRKVSSDEEDELSEDEVMNSVNEEDTSSIVAKQLAPRSKAASKARSRKKVVDSDDEAEDKEDIEVLDAPLREEAAPTKKDSANNDEEDETTPIIAPPVQADGNDSESSLSSLLDEPQIKKKRQKKSPVPKPSKSKPTTKSKPATKKETKDLTTDEEEIKRVQGWLLKCGVRKVWGKELKPFETPKAKIAHLKSLLTDVGLTGRYSVEKARQIKEQRELAADLEAVTAFDQKWGNKEDEARPKERGDMARSLGLDPSLIDDGSEDD